MFFIKIDDMCIFITCISFNRSSDIVSVNLCIISYKLQLKICFLELLQWDLNLLILLSMQM